MKSIDHEYCVNHVNSIVQRTASCTYNPCLCYRCLTVGDIDENDARILAENGDGVFQATWLRISNPNQIYRVEYAIIDDVTYLKSLDKYESYEFEKVFAFGASCHDFVAGKIVVVRSSSY